MYNCSEYLEDELLDAMMEDVLFEELNTVEVEEEVQPQKGSVMGRTYIDRGHIEGHDTLMRDYFSETPVYSDEMFRRRFRMKRDLFLEIAEAIKNHDSYFEQKVDAANHLGLSTLQKVTAAIRQLAYGSAADTVDEYLRMADSTAMVCLKRFCKATVEVFGEEYLRSPNQEDVDRLLRVGEERGFPGMLGSIDCMHWEWKNCPTALHGQYTGKSKRPSVILEAVASHDLWIWHAFFGLPGSLNDINVINRSPVFADLAKGVTPDVRFEVNGNTYTKGYYLADGIYPKYATLVKTIPNPQTAKSKYFATGQEATRKDVERAFGVLQARFAMVQRPARMFKKRDIETVMNSCIILHNKIVENERGQGLELIYTPHSATPSSSREELTFDEFVEQYFSIRDPHTHSQLQKDLIEHLWQRKGNM